jgi:hypothetical protein
MSNILLFLTTLHLEIMRRGIPIILLLVCLLQVKLPAQTLSHQVLVPLAGVKAESNVSFSQTVGETAVEITGCSWYIFTQGFQQPDIRLSDIRPPEGTGIKVYPNPVSEFITVELYGVEARNFIIEYIDIKGSIIRTDKKEFGDNYWYREPQYVGDLISGFYLIRVRSRDGMMNRSFRIEKI